MVILVCGCLIGAIGFGPRAALGLFLTPMSAANGWSREVFSLALAIQVIVWGTAQPFVGAIADRFGTVRVLATGAVFVLHRPFADGLFDHARRARSHRRPA